MIMNKKLIIIGAGPAGLACALGAIRGGLSPEDMLIIEREDELGGVLNQCVHDGFGEICLGKNLTGTEYAEYFASKINGLNIPCMTGTTVLSISREKQITVISQALGYTTVSADAIVIATGCRERSRGSLKIAGTRPAGVFSAGTVQHFVNIEGYLTGKRAIVLGSGDIGLVVARRLKIEGAEVVGVYEERAYPRGMDKNIEQCLKKLDIPFYTQKTVSKILGKERVEGVIICDTDKSRKIIKGTEKLVKCDTIVLSLGLVPDNIICADAGVLIDSATQGAVVDQYYQTNIDGIFACGNALHIHDIVDYITKEGYEAGKYACAYLNGEISSLGNAVNISYNDGIKHTVPHQISYPILSCTDEIVISYRVSRPMKNARISLRIDGQEAQFEAKSELTPSRQSIMVLNKNTLSMLKEARTVSIEATEV